MSTITQTISELSTPPSRTDPTNFDDRADQFLSELPGMATEINTLAGEMNAVAAEVDASAASAKSAESGAIAVVGISGWYPSTTYFPGGCVFGTDGHSYRAVQESTGVDPVSDTGTYWTCLTKPYSCGFKNKIINGRKTINQRDFDGDWSGLNVGDYGWDRWKKHTAGMEQVIEQANIPAGTYTISWTGGGTGYVDDVSVSSGDSVTLDGDADVSIVVPTDATDIQVELGAVATMYESRSVQQELEMCQRYFLRYTGTVYGATYNSNCMISVFFPVFMRGVPVATYTTGGRAGYSFTAEYVHANRIHVKLDETTYGYVQNLQLDAEL